MRLGRDEDLRDNIDWASWAKLPARELMSRLVNDLEPPAFSIRPELGELRERLERELSQVVRMSGSGSSLFTLCDDAETAQSMVERVKKMNAGIGAIAVAIAPK